MTSWLREHPGRVIKMYYIEQIFGKAYNQAVILSNSINGFKTFRIYPSNSNIFIDEQFAPSLTSNIGINPIESIIIKSLPIVKH